MPLVIIRAFTWRDWMGAITGASRCGAMPRSARNGRVRASFNAAHLQRTVVEIVLQHGGDVVMEVTERISSARRWRRCAPNAQTLSELHRRIDVGDIGHAAQTADNLQHPLTRGAEPALQHVADHQCPGVDKRVARFALLDLQLQKRVKGLAGRIFPPPAARISSS